MGEVFRARDQHLDRDVAIKVLPTGVLGDESARRHFRKEALALSKLNHPNIATIHDFDTQCGIDFLVMEHIPGITLVDLPAPLPEKQVISLGLQLAAGLSAAHENGVIHRDLKPANLRLTQDTRLKILDFGLAKLRVPTTATAPTKSVCETGGLAGTLQYMAPEQLMGEEADARTDIYAAGVVLYGMATGQHPLTNGDGSNVIASILRERPMRPSDLNRRLSPALSGIIEKCIEKEPDNRYQSAKELGVDLRRLLREESPIPHSQSVRRPPLTDDITRASKVLAGIAVGLAMLIVLIVFGLMKFGQRAEVPRITPSIAVLPFLDLSATRDQEYLSEGVAEELLNSLTKLPGLRVAARTSAFQFKGKSDDLQAIGRKLNVASVLEGSVQKSGTRVRITVHLVKADTGLSLWSEAYDRDLKDIFAVEDDIAGAVTAALQPKLLGQNAPSPSVSQTTTPEAYQAFLRARSLFRTADVALEPKAFEYLDQAIQIDPTYAPAFALRSVRAAETGLMGRRDLAEAMESSRRDAETAISLDPKLAAGYRALSEVQAMADWDWQAAERSIRRAREIAPGDADVLMQSGYLAKTQGRLEEAADFIRRGVALDPLGAFSYFLLGQVLRDAGHYASAHEALAKSEELTPHQVWVHETRGEVYLAEGRFQDAWVEMEREPEQDWRDFGEALAHHALGQHRESDAALARLSSQHYDTAAYQIAEVYAYRGQSDRAFHWLKRARQQRDGGLANLKVDWLLKSLRQDPRYVQLLREVNLPPE